MKKLTIITVNYNNASGLRKTMESVFAQTCKDFEYIVIDGASTDGSVDVIREFDSLNTQRSTLNAFTWVSEPDTGIYNAMNKGIGLAQGEYVLFMNSGDCFANDRVLEDIVCYLDGTGIVAGNAIEDMSSSKLLAPQLMLPRYILNKNICHQAEFIKRSLFQEIGLYNTSYKVLSDFEFNLKAACRGISYKFVDCLIAIIEPGGLSNRLDNVMDDESREIINGCLPLGVESDYRFWMNHKTYSHPAISWAIDKGWPLRILKVLYKICR